MFSMIIKSFLNKIRCTEKALSSTGSIEMASMPIPFRLNCNIHSAASTLKAAKSLKYLSFPQYLLQPVFKIR